MNIFPHNYVWTEASTVLPPLWWESNGCKMPVVRDVAKKVTALCCGPGDAECDW